jgi:predicted nucleotidyltransferase
MNYVLGYMSGTSYYIADMIVNYIYLEIHWRCIKVNKLDHKKIALEFSNLIKNKYNSQIKEVILFGSVVRGETNSDSDIDIFVICKGDRFKVRRAIMVDVINFLLKYGIYISIKTLSTEDVSNINNTGFMQHIAKEGVSIG